VGFDSEKGLVGAGYAYANDVAAVPSLHAAISLLVVQCVWPRRWWLRLLAASYPLAMAFSIVYTAEHYVADVLLGWLYAAASFLAIRWAAATIGRVRRDRRKAIISVASR
jgi:membrane-associated phospholipid phosphatase